MTIPIEAPIDTAVDKMKRRFWPDEQRHELRGDAGLARLMTAFFVYCPAISYRPALLPAGRFDPRWKQVMDLDLFARVLLAGGSIALLPDRAYRYRRHDAAATARNSRTSVRRIEEVAVIREIVDAARPLSWRRTVRAGRLRLTVRANDWLSRRS